MDEAKKARARLLIKRLVAEHGQGNERAIAAHRPIYDRTHFEAMKHFDNDTRDAAMEMTLLNTDHPAPGFYRHYKGQRYEVIDVAQHSETREWVVVYRALYGERGLWVRPLDMFTESVEVDGKTVPRFAWEASS
jgi:hypothetical protein